MRSPKRRKYPNSTIYQATGLDFVETLERLRGSPNVRNPDVSQKGQILCTLRKPEVFVQITPSGKVMISYNGYDDGREAARVLSSLVVCTDFKIDRDIPRTLDAVEEGIETTLRDLTDQYPFQSLITKYIDGERNSPRTFWSLTKRLVSAHKDLLLAAQEKEAAEKIEGTTRWIVCVGVVVDQVGEEAGVPRKLRGNYAAVCDWLETDLESRLGPDYAFCEDLRDGEVLSLRYAFDWNPRERQLSLPIPVYWEVLELDPFDEVYPEA